MYEAQVRYVGGLNTARIENMKISAERLRYNLDVEMSIGHLPMSFRIAQCLLFNKCLALFDSLDACCGRERKLSFRLAMQCSPQKPFIRGTAIQNLKFEKPLVIAPKFFRLIPVKVREITNDVESTVQQQVTEMLPRTPWLDLNGNGKLETLAGALNDIIMTELAKIPVNIPFPCLEWKEEPKGKN
ncbi:hypothetical protein BKA69DRAFT_662647 [Paraphysoderma sedebokerense]|nr:hypothetical protein BKA69DRAFT_662647 [Paraphysoderma sedebokerense]